MSQKNPKVLIIATSHKTRGGITSVIKAHETSQHWRKYHCKWLETHRDGNLLIKLWYFITALLLYVITLPFYDIIHIHLSEPSSAIRKFIFFIYAKLWRKKIIVHFHSFSPETTIRSKHRNVYKYLFSQANCIIVLSNHWKKIVTETFPFLYKIKVIYNPCTATISAIQYPEKNQILYAGIIHKRKGYADLITAFTSIAKKYPDWQLIIAGCGEIEQAKSLAKGLEIENQIVFPGWINGEVKDKTFKEASIFCLPSYAEGFPMAVLDAWAYGLPVLTTPVGGLPDIVKDGLNSLLFEPGDVQKLAFQLEKMISDEKLRHNIGLESLKLANTVFSIETIDTQLQHLYESILQNK